MHKKSKNIGFPNNIATLRALLENSRNLEKSLENS